MLARYFKTLQYLFGAANGQREQLVLLRKAGIVTAQHFLIPLTTIRTSTVDLSEPVPGEGLRASQVGLAVHTCGASSWDVEAGG